MNLNHYLISEPNEAIRLQIDSDATSGVFTSLLIFFSVFAALMLIRMMRSAAKENRANDVLRWWLGASLTLGCGVFIANLVNLPGEFRYSFIILTIPAAVALFSCAASLWCLQFAVITKLQLVGATVLMGLGISITHFLAVAAVGEPVALRYESGALLLAALSAVVLNSLAFLLFFYFSVKNRPGSMGFDLMATASVGGMLLLPLFVGVKVAQFYLDASSFIDAHLYDFYLNPKLLSFEMGLVYFVVVLLMILAARHHEKLNAIIQEYGELSKKLLKEQLEKKRMFDALNKHAIVSITDTSGVINFVSDNFCLISGFSREELIGSSHNIVNSGYDSDTDWDDVWKTIQRGDLWSGIVCNRRKNGDLYWVQTVITSFKDLNGDIENYVSIRFDVTSQHKLQVELERTLNILQGALEAVDEAFAVFDTNDRLVYFNDRYRNVYQTTRDLIELGVTFESLVRNGAESGQYVAASGRVDEWIRERMALHQAERSEFLQVQADGTVLKIMEKRTSAGYTVGFRVDVTELIKAKESAQAASQIQTEFLANMSHEIRTPISAVQGMLALLQKTALSKQQRDYTDKAHLAARSLLGLLNDILDTAKITEGQLHLENEPFLLDEVVHELGAIFSGALMTDQVEILIDLDQNARQLVRGDRLRLQQALLNLGSNALKFTEKGLVCLRIRVVSQDAANLTLLFEVEDTGIGISDEFQGVIFKAFTQADSSVSRKYGGTGLGMKITYDLVQLMGGELRIDSELGRGSRFYFELSLDRMPQNESHPWPLSDGKAPRVLMVDDIVQVRQLLRELGVSMGWDVQVCDSGPCMLQKLREAHEGTCPPWDVVFLDHNMPGMSGLEACEKLRQWDQVTPVVLLLTHYDQHVLAPREMKWRHLINAQITKPVTASALFDAWVDLYQQTQPGSAALQPQQAEQAPPPLAGLHILLAEDNPVNQQVAWEWLTSEGAEVQVADNGQIAVDMLLAEPDRFVIVLMDMQMPVLSGVEATRAIRANPLFQDLPIIAMTANARAEDRQQCIDAGMNDHVSKPLDWDKLVDVIVQYVGRSAVRQP